MAVRERRKYMRIGTKLEAEYWAKGPTMASGLARVLDFCREGLGILFPEPVNRGERVELTLRVPGESAPILATAEVAWAQAAPVGPAAGPAPAAGLRSGLRFVSIKPLDLARLLDFTYSRWLGQAQRG